MNCHNCAGEVSGKYCHQCGQKTGVPRITWRYLLDELQARLFGFDNRFLRTVRDLTIRPERVVQSVIDGIRVQYFGPLSYYFLLITIYVLLVSMLDIDMAAYTRTITEGLQSSENAAQQGTQEALYNSIFSNFRFFSFVMVPFFILGTHLFFINKKYNFLETAVLVFYAMGHPIILNILFLIPLKFGYKTSFTIILTLITYAYFAWVCARFYSGNRLWNFSKGLLAVIASMILLMLISGMLMIIYAFINPEFRENFQ